MPVKFEWTNIEAFAADHFGAPRPRLLHSGVNGRFWIFDIGCDVGEGVVEYYQLPAGFNVLVIDCQLEQKREITVNDGGGIRLNFALALDVIMSPAGHEATHAATQSWRVVNAGNQADITEHLAPQTRHCWMTIHTAPEWLARLTGQTIADLPELLQPLPEYADRQAVNSAFFNQRPLFRAVSDVVGCGLHGDLRLSYIAARAQEMACLSVNMLLEPTRKPPDVRLSDRERAAIEEVGAQLRIQYRSPPTVEALARHAGLNRNKLYYGFRDVFGVSISKFIQNVRLERAYALLTTGTMPLIELVDETGFGHQSNFSTAIRNRYGKTPREIRAEAAQQAVPGLRRAWLHFPKNILRAREYTALPAIHTPGRQSQGGSDRTIAIFRAERQRK
jgi:AraC-like DNA-binding protein